MGRATLKCARVDAVLYEMFTEGQPHGRVVRPWDKYVLCALRAHLGLPAGLVRVNTVASTAADFWVDATPLIRLWAEMTGLEAVAWVQEMGVSCAKLADAIVEMRTVEGVTTDELIIVKAVIYGVPATRIEKWAIRHRVKTGRALVDAMRLVLDAVVVVRPGINPPRFRGATQAMKILGDTQVPFIKRLRALAQLEVGKSLFVE